MFIIQLTGGLGNQLFQYAFTRHLSIKYNCEIRFDISQFSCGEQRSFEIFNLKTQGNIATSEDIKKIKLEDSAFSLLKRKLITLSNPYYKRIIVEEKRFEFDQKLLEVRPDRYLIGNFQSESYFKPIEGLLRKEINAKENILSPSFYIQRSELQEKSISLHIRRGDYINDPETNLAHGLCSMNYYIEAMEFISSRELNPIFYIFSDDILWCKQNLKTNFPTYFMDNAKNHFEDLFLMASCRHNIIANSSFSWWAAWLNKNQQKMVVAPQKWFNKRNSNTKDLIPSTWTIL